MSVREAANPYMEYAFMIGRAAIIVVRNGEFE